MLRLERRLPFAVVAATFAISLGTACKRAERPEPPPPEVLVTEVVQKDVPIYTEWVGTTVGFVNAQVMPRLQGYLLTAGAPLVVLPPAIPGVGQAGGVDFFVQDRGWAVASPLPRARAGEAKLIIPFTNPEIVGRFVFHRHVVKHEDKGMMQTVEVSP